MARLGKLPAVGDRVEINDHLVQVLEVEGRRASRLRVEPLPDPEAATAAS
jgi:putative hemolysin